MHSDSEPLGSSSTHENEANPYSTPQEAGTSEVVKPPRRFPTLVELVVVFFIIVILVGLLIPARRSARPAARRMQCMNNLKQLALALHNYESANQAFPPAYTLDEDGNRLHSWRVLILPYIEGGYLYKKIDLSKAWDDPANALAFDQQPHVFRCPSTELKPGFTSYVASCGENYCLHPTRGRKSSELRDDPGETIMVFECTAKESMHWMDPSDDRVPLSEIRGHAHSGGINAATADGAVIFLSDEMDASSLEAAKTIDAGDKADLLN